MKKAIWIASFASILQSCSTAPAIHREAVSTQEAKRWFQQVCSSRLREVSGDLVVRSKTKEFKGQFPASVLVEKTGAFHLEVTNIVGGTMLLIASNGKTMDISVPSRPQFNQSQVNQYLGLPLSVLSQLLTGDLPCPIQAGLKNVSVRGNQMQLTADHWVWAFEKTEAGAPSRILLTPEGASEKNRIEVSIEDWDSEHHLANRVQVHGPEGDLKWTWRSRKEK